MRLAPMLFGTLLLAAPAAAQTNGSPQPGAAASLDHRLREIEDRLALYELIASVPPSADTASGWALDRLYTEDGAFDRGQGLQGATGREAVKQLITRPEHHTAVAGGLAHFPGLPSIDLRGDVAYVTSYLMLIQPDGEGRPRELSNHGVSTGFRIHRVLANRWECVRTADGWRIRRRTAIPLDGGTQAVGVLRQGIEKYGTR